MQGKLLGQTQSLGFSLKEEKNLETLTLDVLKLSEIEGGGELNYEQVRLSIARAISDMLLARSENSAERFYSLSNQIHTEKKQYYEVLQQSDAGRRSAHYQLCP
ncbi:hypothetical protein FACS189411_06860 [Bacteroidia bacterium]|nr:hypothetical protein FACS189411_06860 [Bacteroidia bacterium]